MNKEKIFLFNHSFVEPYLEKQSHHYTRYKA